MKIRDIFSGNCYKNKFFDLYKKPEWQKRRLEILERDNWTCQGCGDKKSTLHVHHKYYEKGKLPWQYPTTAFITLCEACHDNEGNYDFYMNMLKDSLKDKFLTEHIGNLASAFYYMKLSDTPEIVIRAYSWAIGNQKVQKELIKKYRKNLNGTLRKIKAFFKRLR